MFCVTLTHTGFEFRMQPRSQLCFQSSPFRSRPSRNWRTAIVARSHLYVRLQNDSASWHSATIGRRDDGAQSWPKICDWFSSGTEIVLAEGLRNMKAQHTLN